LKPGPQGCGPGALPYHYTVLAAGCSATKTWVLDMLARVWVLDMLARVWVLDMLARVWVSSSRGKVMYKFENSLTGHGILLLT